MLIVTSSVRFVFIAVSILGCSWLPHGQVDNQTDQQCGPGDQQRSDREQPAEADLPGELPRVDGREDHPGSRPQRADLPGRNRGVGHRKHEVHGTKEMFYLMMHSTHFIYGYMASDIW